MPRWIYIEFRKRNSEWRLAGPDILTEHRKVSRLTRMSHNYGGLFNEWPVGVRQTGTGKKNGHWLSVLAGSRARMSHNYGGLFNEWPVGVRQTGTGKKNGHWLSVLAGSRRRRLEDSTVLLPRPSDPSNVHSSDPHECRCPLQLREVTLQYWLQLLTCPPLSHSVRTKE